MPPTPIIPDLLMKWFAAHVFIYSYFHCRYQLFGGSALKTIENQSGTAGKPN